MSEMKLQKKRDEITKILTMIYFEWGKPVTEELVSYWVQNVHGMHKEFVWAVARELIKNKTFGEPKFQDFWQLALKMSSRVTIPVPYNPKVNPGPAVYYLADIPGTPRDDSPVETWTPEPLPGEQRRVITSHEKKLLEMIPIKGMN